MIDLENWLASGGLSTDMINDFARAAGISYMSNYAQGVDLVLVRSGSSLETQRVITPPISGTTVEQQFGQGSQQRTGTLDLLLIGPKNHPSLPDFNVKRGDKFTLTSGSGDNQIVARYEVMFVDTSLNGKIEAKCMAIQ